MKKIYLSLYLSILSILNISALETSPNLYGEGTSTSAQVYFTFKNYSLHPIELTDLLFYKDNDPETHQFLSPSIFDEESKNFKNIVIPAAIRVKKESALMKKVKEDMDKTTDLTKKERLSKIYKNAEKKHQSSSLTDVDPGITHLDEQYISGFSEEEESLVKSQRLKLASVGYRSYKPGNLDSEFLESANNRSEEFNKKNAGFVNPIENLECFHSKTIEFHSNHQRTKLYDPYLKVRYAAPNN